MHEKMKGTLGKLGTSHAPDTVRDESTGHHHHEMHEHEKRALEGKKHHSEMEL